MDECSPKALVRLMKFVYVGKTGYVRKARQIAGKLIRFPAIA